jgi:hypothetical protein
MKLKFIHNILLGKSVLYFGFDKDSRFDWYDYLQKLGFDTFDVIEGFESNVQFIKDNYAGKFRNIFLSDIRNIEKLNLSKYDLIYWEDGPEHVRKEDLEILLPKLEKLARVIVIEGPGYDSNVPEREGNKYSEHVFSLTKFKSRESFIKFCKSKKELKNNFFQKFGYNVSLCKKDDRLIAWKIIERIYKWKII